MQQQPYLFKGLPFQSRIIGVIGCIDTGVTDDCNKSSCTRFVKSSLGIRFNYGLYSMYRTNYLILTLCSIFMIGCASMQEAKTTPPVKTSKAKTEVRTVKSDDGTINGEIVGIPPKGSKFSKLKIGMSLEQVKDIIGKPNHTDSRVTGKQYQPFYFGGDTQRVEAFYKYEGRLTFSNIKPDSAPDTLIQIMVNPDTY